MNGLLRQYFLKGSCLSDYFQNKLVIIAEQPNSCPKKTLNFKTPAYKLQEVLQRLVESITIKNGNITTTPIQMLAFFIELEFSDQ